MIDKVGASTDTSLAELKRIAKGNDTDWDEYVKAIEDLKTNPPRQFAVTIPRFTAYPGVELPAWRIPDKINRGLIDPAAVPPTYNVRTIVTEPWLKILQAGVGSSYLQDIVEIDPLTEKPLDSGKGEVDDSCSCNHSHNITTAPEITTTETQKTESSSQTKQATPSLQTPQRSASTTATKTQSQPTATNTAFDFTKLSPELQETALRLAEQLLSAALQRLSGAAQTNTQLSTLFDRTT